MMIIPTFPFLFERLLSNYDTIVGQRLLTVGVGGPQKGDGGKSDYIDAFGADDNAEGNGCYFNGIRLVSVFRGVLVLMNI